MRRIINLLAWEFNEHLRVLVSAAGILTTGLVFQHRILISIGKFTSVPGSVSGLRSMSGLVITMSATSSSFWVTASFFILLLTALIFRAGIERGYELTAYSLPYSKLEVFSAKFLAGFLLSSLVVLLPILVLIPVNFADTPGFALSILTDGRFIGLVILILMAVLYVASVAVFLSVSLRNLLAALVFAFPVLIIPYLINVNLPPGNLFNSAAGDVLFGSYFSLGRLVMSRNVLTYGLFLPALLIVASALLTLRRDVK